MNHNVVVLTLAQVLSMSISPALMFIGTIIGQQLAPSPAWATLPIAFMVIGTALGAYPLVILMQRQGRKPVFIGAVLAVALACLLMAWAMHLRSFSLFCVAVSITGACLAAIQQFRFAAMESVGTDKAAMAASSVMLAGVAAAIVGPELALRGEHWFAAGFSGSFVLLAGAYLLAALVLCFYRQPAEVHSHGDARQGSARQLFAEPLFWVAVLGGAGGFAIMTFVMTATPISMHDHSDHSLVDTKWVIQSHVIAMFLPSLVLPLLTRRFGIQPVMVAGFFCYLVTIVIGLSDPGLWYFWFALIFLGIGWNFLFLGATTLLPSTHKPEYHLKAQAVNDTVVFSMQAIAALCSGVILNLWGWHSVLLGCLPIILALLCVQLVCNRKHRQMTVRTAT